MGHHISVFYFVIEHSEIPTSMDSWIDVSDLLAKYYESKDGLGYQSVSRNWWHQYTLDDVCKGLGIEGLEFVVKEVVCLESMELRQAQGALEEVIREFSRDAPRVSSTEFDIGHSSWLRKKHSSEEMKNAFAEAKSSNDVDAAFKFGYEELVGFFSFIKSLNEVVTDAIAQERPLMFVQPQP